MKLKAFGIFDTKANLYNTPFFMNTRGEALRAFKDLANNRETTIGRHPEDYRLDVIGEFDNETGAFEESQDHLGFGIDYVDLPAGAVPIGVSHGK
jgi:hypothetical protein